MKFIAMIQDRLKSITHAVIRFPLVFGFLCALAVFASMSIETQHDYTKEIFALIVGVFLSAAMQIRYENSDNPRFKLLVSKAVVLGLTAAYYWGVLYQYDGGVAGMLRTLILSFALLIVFLWLPSARWKAVFTSGFFTVVIFGGIMLVVSAVDNLLFRVPNNLYSHIAVWSWIAFAPMLFLSLIPVFGGTDEDKARQEHLSRIPAFFKMLLNYVLIPLAILYTLVLISYLIKTFVSGDPGDLLEPLILSYSIAVILLYVLVSGIESKIAAFYRLVFPKVMAVIALYQVVISCMKIPAEGVTYGRYFVILFGIFSVVSGVLMSVLPHSRNWIIAVVLTGFALVSIVPPVDAFSVGTRSQVQILEQVLNSNQMISDGKIVPNKAISDADKKKITNTVQYLYDVKDIDKVMQLPAKFELYPDFETTFGFSPYYPTTVADVQQTTSKFYTLDSSKPIEVGTYEYLLVINANKNDSNSSEMKAAYVTDQGKTYDVYLVNGKDQFDIQLRDSQGKILLSASLRDMIDGMSMTNGGVGKDMQPPDQMTYDEAGDAVSMRIIFQNASTYENGSDTTYNAAMYVLVSVN